MEGLYWPRMHLRHHELESVCIVTADFHIHRVSHDREDKLRAEVDACRPLCMLVNDPAVDVQQTIATRLNAVVNLACDEQFMAPAHVQQLLSSPVCGIPAMQALATLAQAFC